VLAVGLTGGMGSGKSTAARLLVDRGAVLIDADAIARQVVEPGRPAHRALVDRFGPGILAPEGTIDRPALAKVAFGDPAALRDLNSITHPAIAQVMTEQRAALEETDSVVILDIPLMTPGQRELLSLDVVVVVDCDPEVALARVVSDRGLDPDDVRARMAAQPSREDRLDGADLVVDNNGDRRSLNGEVERVWASLRQRAAAKAAGRAGGSGARGS
jgi:dephospho-CoA kinase